MTVLRSLDASDILFSARKWCLFTVIWSNLLITTLILSSPLTNWPLALLHQMIHRETKTTGNRWCQQKEGDQIASMRRFSERIDCEGVCSLQGTSQLLCIKQRIDEVSSFLTQIVSDDDATRRQGGLFFVLQGWCGKSQWKRMRERHVQPDPLIVSNLSKRTGALCVCLAAKTQK